MDAYSTLFSSFNEEIQRFFNNLFEEYHFTVAERLALLKDEADLLMADERDLLSVFDLTKADKLQGKRRKEELMRQEKSYMHSLRYSETDYSTFTPPPIKRKRETVDTVADENIALMGRCPCPVDGEKTRCCKLVTLDAVTGCNFGCAYCSVQSFYSEGKIRAVSNLDERLKTIDTSSTWHIGTGQASDSLLLGNSHNTLTNLATFAANNSSIILELKSKSANRDFLKVDTPRNMVFTWSLNARTIIEKEEHYTASLEERIKSARLAADKGALVGFHIHPMVFFKNWQNEYKEVVSLIVNNFSSDEICMISMGTLTFTKSVLRQMREKRNKTKVLLMPLEESAGKYTYSNEIKDVMFSTVYRYFPQEFRDNIFFYLCMEDPSLWPSVLEREYSSDAEFEKDMKRAYFEKVNRCIAK